MRVSSHFGVMAVVSIMLLIAAPSASIAQSHNRNLPFSDSLKQLASDYNAFGINLFKKVVEENPTENVFTGS